MKKIIVIDDLATVRIQAKRALEKGGFSVGAVGKLAEAISMFKDADAVLVDYNMPGLRGDYVASRIKSHHPALKVFIYSNEPVDRMKAKAAEIGADGVVTNKGDGNALVSQMRAMLP